MDGVYCDQDFVVVLPIQNGVLEVVVVNSDDTSLFPCMHQKGGCFQGGRVMLTCGSVCVLGLLAWSLLGGVLFLERLCGAGAGL